MTAWHEHPIVVIDFETTGPDPGECMPVQVGCARYEGRKLVDQSACYINPGIPIPEEATAIHGIKYGAVSACSPPAEALEHLRPMLRGAVPCGYNGQAFDRVIWERFADSLGPWIDPLVMVRHVDRFIRGKGRYKLEVTCCRWHVELENAHDALSDCKGTAGLLFSDRMRELLGGMQLGELFERQEFHRAEQEKRFQGWLAKQPAREE